MQEEILLQISGKIKERRKALGITVQELADKAEVSKGLISQIENSRTIPSLMVLMDIIKSLEVDLNSFFKGINFHKKDAPVLVKRKDQYQQFEKEQAVGFNYSRILTKNIKFSTADFVLLELEVNAQRPMVKTEAFEFKYMIEGKVEYQFSNKKIILEKGDSMLFDGRLSHTPVNIGDDKALMLVIYFFE
ncbi:helix-turn-helix domain-containing protein [Pedobacter sp. KACC 23697]|uniref:XRE family transcriptional regulator n=1 Tax=Pedobacter sp. KACC 23697 TaxID=3149230 RepID=A0AAU7K5W6_9SPHI